VTRNYRRTASLLRETTRERTEPSSRWGRSAQIGKVINFSEILGNVSKSWDSSLKFWDSVPKFIQVFALSLYDEDFVCQLQIDFVCQLRPVTAPGTVSAGTSLIMQDLAHRVAGSLPARAASLSVARRACAGTTVPTT
jgi:hypothetical protein